MADFCKQCGIEMFGEDFRDLAGLGDPNEVLGDGYGYPVLCEGCGSALVTKDGTCISKDCLKKHGGERALVVHCKKSKFEVYIGRPSKYGNPFRIGTHGTREEVIVKYEQWIRTQPQLVADVKAELKGKVLGCWCAPNACHGDVLARIAEEG